MPRRMQSLHEQLSAIIALHDPTTAAVEKLFFQKNVRTAMAVGQARGIALLALGGGRPGRRESTLRSRSSRRSPATAARASGRSSKWCGPSLALDDIPAPGRRRRCAGRRHLSSAVLASERFGGGHVIASLRGRVEQVAENSVVVEVGGVGLLVAVPAPLAARLQPGQPVALFTRLIVREDALALYRFRIARSTRLLRPAAQCERRGAQDGHVAALAFLHSKRCTWRSARTSPRGWRASPAWAARPPRRLSFISKTK